MKLGIVMDPIQRITIKKDSSFAMLLAAQARGMTLFYMEAADLFLLDGKAYAKVKKLSVNDDEGQWFQFHSEEKIELSSLDLILMRLDPPVDQEYYVTSYILEQAQRAGALVVNDPQSLRDVNEKVYCTWFAEFMVPTLVSKDQQELKAFFQVHGEIILKPLHSMGGDSIFRVKQGDLNFNVILENMTRHGREYIMAQAYIAEIRQGDKRILLIDGKPVSHALARIPQKDETRGNLAAGGRAEALALSKRDHVICSVLGPKLVKKGLLFVGLDVIGDYLTEINVTSPTCIRELDRACGLDIAGDFMDCLISRLKKTN